MSGETAWIVLVGMICGVVGTGLGAVLAYAVKGRSARGTGVVLEFAAGVMTSVVCFDLLPQALSLAGTVSTFLGFLCGVSMAMVLQDAIKYRPGRANQGSAIGRTGFVVMAAVAMHNFPEGLAVGAGLEVSMALGIEIAVAIALHDIPEGLAMAVPLKLDGQKGAKVIALTAATGLPMGVGSLVGALAGGVSPLAVGACLACAGGAMLYVVSGDLLTESKNIYQGRLGAVSNLAGFVAGALVALLL